MLGRDTAAARGVARKGLHTTPAQRSGASVGVSSAIAPAPESYGPGAGAERRAEAVQRRSSGLPARKSQASVSGRGGALRAVSGASRRAAARPAPLVIPGQQVHETKWQCHQSCKVLIVCSCADDAMQNCSGPEWLGAKVAQAGATVLQTDHALRGETPLARRTKVLALPSRWRSADACRSTPPRLTVLAPQVLSVPRSDLGQTNGAHRCPAKWCRPPPCNDMAHADCLALVLDTNSPYRQDLASPSPSGERRPEMMRYERSPGLAKVVGPGPLGPAGQCMSAGRGVHHSALLCRPVCRAKQLQRRCV
jgi:hypothetical protein